ncbi:oxaloacetate decarboxylase [Bosea sp. (in: a-proteobacteria)]|uniref:isocitrate lyase/PEP mutase family protein n=1 Tax=Bosea sp. (in: a-proteobacteria) TaxID=1871050 RepID=UPI0026057E44|nr:oxaloacetate decarboxylase [Bosea sp. (in: a-proteobacteria)]MCO5089848.1 oxaloacetate decarboxylase [Bosea sp. (in: a-proteobacteria)]
MSNARKMRDVFAKEKIVVIPGAYDALSALLVQKTGFPAAYLGGFSISASMAGYPDWGFTTMTEMLSVAVNAINVLDVPVLCDIDQGFGALTNFARTIHAYENAGVAAVHFEDQPFPKKCSQQANRAVIPLADAVAKVKVAVETRSNPDFMLIARTDSKGIEGLDGLKRRMGAYLDAGADYCIFCEQQTEEELRAVGEAFPGRVIAFVGDVPENPACCLPVSAYQEMGYKGLVYCALGLSAAYRGMQNSFEHLLRQRHVSSGDLTRNNTSLGEIQSLAKIKQWQELRDRFDML